MEDAKPMRSRVTRYTRPILAVVIIYLILLLGPVASFDLPTIAASITEIIAASIAACIAAFFRSCQC